ncbi:glycine-rich domain-containing protein [Escherichia coli]|uniref:glycine-rich domain-containing protein n=1 Tax=Escherichia coli TaxID=562 RepID=UPI003F857C28
MFSTAGVSTWTVPDELKSGRKAKVTVIGAGGSGGRSSCGGGGGGGGKAVKLVDLTGIESVPITVGAGGGKPAAGSTSIPGNSGGSSSFGTFCSATGGNGGGNVSGGSSGIGVNGDINTGTGPGNPGAFQGSNSYVSGSGGGAGGPGSLSSSNSDGFDAIGPGGGGSGAATGSTTVSCRPGAGYSGMVLIEW